MKGCRVTKIEQVGMERLVRIALEAKDTNYFIFVEFYSQGNFVFTNSKLEIILCQRKYKYDEENICDVGQRYPLELSAVYFRDRVNLTASNLSKIIKSQKKLNNVNVLKRLVPSAHQFMIYYYLDQFNLTNKFNSDKVETLLEIAQKIFKHFDL